MLWFLWRLLMFQVLFVFCMHILTAFLLTLHLLDTRGKYFNITFTSLFNYIQTCLLEQKIWRGWLIKTHVRGSLNRICLKGKNHEPHFHFNENIISFQGGISKVYIRHFAWANGRVAVAGVQGGRRGGWSGATPRAPPAPFAGSIRHLSWSPWRPRTERGGAAASGWWVHGAPRSPRALAKWKNRYNLIWDKSLYKNCRFEDSFKLYLLFVLFHLASITVSK